MAKEHILINKIIKRYKESTGAQRRNSETSRKWFKDNLRKSYGHVRAPNIIKGSDFISKPKIGGLYHFNYNPKHKATLPIYDTFPLVFPFSVGKTKAGDSYFMGINMHYLPPKIRVAVFTSMLKLKTGSGYKPNTRLALNYSKLSSMANSKYVKNAVKMYLVDHMESKFIKVEPNNWEIVISLPTERFKKGGNKTAWKL
jgi:hypothetical protein